MKEDSVSNQGIQQDAGGASLLSYKPSVFYFRKALRETATRETAVAVGLTICHELEQLKAWVRDQGMVPPKWIVDPEEAHEKGWTAEPTGTSSTH